MVRVCAGPARMRRTGLGAAAVDGCGTVLDLPGRVPFLAGVGRRGLGCVCPRPRLAGPVGPQPQTPAPAGWGACAPGPVVRGLGATKPQMAAPAPTRRDVSHRECGLRDGSRIRFARYDRYGGASSIRAGLVGRSRFARRAWSGLLVRNGRLARFASASGRWRGGPRRTPGGTGSRPGRGRPDDLRACPAALRRHRDGRFPLDLEIAH